MAYIFDLSMSLSSRRVQHFRDTAALYPIYDPDCCFGMLSQDPPDPYGFGSPSQDPPDPCCFGTLSQDPPDPYGFVLAHQARIL